MKPDWRTLLAACLVGIASGVAIPDQPQSAIFTALMIGALLLIASYGERSGRD